MKKLIYSYLSVILVIFTNIALSQTDVTKKSLIFGETINVSSPFPYQLPALIDSTQSQTQEYNNYCPPCALKDAAQCGALMCQTANIKKNGTYNNIEVTSDKWMEMANTAALESIKQKGGPFAAVILQIDDKTGKVIRYWLDHNHVVEWKDPTAHAEMSTIRTVTKKLGVFDLGHIRKEDSKLPQPSELSHCVIYSSAEPCPMCLSAIYWAGIKSLVFAATRYDAAVRGVNFSDAMIYDELKLPYSKRHYMTVRQSTTNNSLSAFNYYKRNHVPRYGEA